MLRSSSRLLHAGESRGALRCAEPQVTDRRGGVSDAEVTRDVGCGVDGALILCIADINNRSRCLGYSAGEQSKEGDSRAHSEFEVDLGAIKLHSCIYAFQQHAGQHLREQLGNST